MDMGARRGGAAKLAALFVAIVAMVAGVQAEDLKNGQQTWPKSEFPPPPYLTLPHHYPYTPPPSKLKPKSEFPPPPHPTLPHHYHYHYHYAPPPVKVERPLKAVVIGHVQCHVCREKRPLPGAKVDISCWSGESESSFYGVTNEKGEFHIELEGFDYRKYGGKACEAKLAIAPPHSSCKTPTTFGPTHLHIKSKTEEEVVLFSKPFSFVSSAQCHDAEEKPPYKHPFSPTYKPSPPLYNKAHSPPLPFYQHTHPPPPHAQHYLPPLTHEAKFPPPHGHSYKHLPPPYNYDHKPPPTSHVSKPPSPFPYQPHHHTTYPAPPSHATYIHPSPPTHYKYMYPPSPAHGHVSNAPHVVDRHYTPPAYHKHDSCPPPYKHDEAHPTPAISYRSPLSPPYHDKSPPMLPYKHESPPASPSKHESSSPPSAYKHEFPPPPPDHHYYSPHSPPHTLLPSPLTPYKYASPLPPPPEDHKSTTLPSTNSYKSPPLVTGNSTPKPIPSFHKYTIAPPSHS